ncbi:MAG: DUF167 family protein [Methanomicrobiales archaeon]|nr:DUF167 family protein [Methanomicrobiales archaeon]
MKRLEDAVNETEEGCILRIHLISGSRTEVFFQGYDSWRDSFIFHVQSEARDGRANHELLLRLAELLKTPRHSIAILRGERSHSKRILVKGLKKGWILELLSGNRNV